jgi:hypothetical protein
MSTLPHKMKKIEETKSKEDRKVSMSTGGNNEVAEIRKTRILNTSRYSKKYVRKPYLFFKNA